MATLTGCSHYANRVNKSCLGERGYLVFLFSNFNQMWSQYQHFNLLFALIDFTAIPNEDIGQIKFSPQVTNAFSLLLGAKKKKQGLRSRRRNRFTIWATSLSPSINVTTPKPTPSECPTRRSRTRPGIRIWRRNKRCKSSSRRRRRAFGSSCSLS